MFNLAVLVGIYSYSIFLIGIFGLLNNSTILFISTLFFLISPLVIKSSLPQIVSLSKTSFGLILILFFLSLVNLFGALGPELAFDALWYHLTIPKIWIAQESINFLPGPVFKYSVMPKLIDILYIPALIFGNEITAKLIHFGFGLLSILITYKLARLFLGHTWSILASLVLTSNLVFAWQSITAYIDLGRTFFEALAIYVFLQKNVYKSAISLGLATASKLLSIATLPIYFVLLTVERYPMKTHLKFLTLCLAVPMPWFVFSYLTTGNPIYPFFNSLYPSLGLSFNPTDILNFFINIEDPISPIYLITLPLTVFLWRRWSRRVKLLFLYCLLTIVVWFLSPRTGGGRFILPFLPAWSVMCVIIIFSVRDKLIKRGLIFVCLLLSFITLFYRAVANYKFIPVITGVQTKSDFLSKNLNYSFGDFYDVDGYLSEKVSPDDKVLIMGINNLFYINFPFIHYSYLTPQDSFNFVLIRYTDASLPPQFSHWKKIYSNDINKVFLYQKP